MCSCGSATVWTHWGRFGWPAARIRWTATTAPALTDSCSAATTAARLPVCGAPGPAGLPAVFPVDRAREPDTGEDTAASSWDLDEGDMVCFVNCYILV